jgi:hypothetical protein
VHILKSQSNCPTDTLSFRDTPLATISHKRLHFRLATISQRVRNSGALTTPLSNSHNFALPSTRLKLIRLFDPTIRNVTESRIDEKNFPRTVLCWQKVCVLVLNDEDEDFLVECNSSISCRKKSKSAATGAVPLRLFLYQT